MRRETIISALVALAFVSCAKIENDVRYNGEFGYEESSDAVDFSWYISRALTTKADTNYFVGDATTTGTERHLNSGTSMGVFGYFHPQYTSGGTTYAGSWDDGVNENHPNLFYNEAVSITESSGTYTYDYANSRYWPKNTYDRISFIAYYPWNELNTSGSASSSTIVEPFLDTYYAREGMVGFYYVVPEDADDQIDFCVSDLCMDQSKALWGSDSSQGLTGNTNGKVKFFFHHTLSQVRVKSVAFDTGGNTDVSVNINYILFSGVPVYGQCIPVPDEDYYGDSGSAHYDSAIAATGRVHVDPTWYSLVTTRPNLTSGITADVCYDSDTDTWDVSEFLLTIPHNFKSEEKIEVNFDIVRAKDATTGEYYPYKNNTLSAALSTTSVSAWEAGKIYTYNITLAVDQIKVTADVVDWLDAGEDVEMTND